MKRKNLAKACFAVLALPLVLTGCATVGNVLDENGNNIYFEDITYFGGNGVKVGDYLYYANGYTEVGDGTSFNYQTAAETGYLSRINLSDDIGASSNQEAPNDVEIVNDKAVGYENQYMFAYQNYLYFTSANQHQTASLENDYTRVSVFRVRFNGDGVQELFTTRYDSSSFITAVEGSDGRAYIITYAETDRDVSSDTTEYDISVMPIGDSLGSREVVVENATSAVVDSDENSQIKSVFYTKLPEVGQSTSNVFAYDYATKQTTDYFVENFGSTTELLAKIDDQLFYTYTSKTVTQVYKTDLLASDKILGSESDVFHPTSSMSNIYRVADGTPRAGYVFVGSSSNLMYKADNARDAVPILTSSNFEDILFVSGDYVYFSNSTSIGRVTFIENGGEYKQETLVTMTSIVSGEYAFVDGYIYFYAQYEPVEVEEGEDSVEYETDESIYMYRIQAGSPEHIGPYQLIGKNKVMPVVEDDEE